MIKNIRNIDAFNRRDFLKIALALMVTHHMSQRIAEFHAQTVTDVNIAEFGVRRVMVHVQEDLAFRGVHDGVAVMTEMFGRCVYGAEIVRQMVRIRHHQFDILLLLVNDLHDEEIGFVDQEDIALGHQ